MKMIARLALMHALYGNVNSFSKKALRDIVTDNNKLAGLDCSFGSIKYKDQIYEVERPEYFEYRFVKTYPPLHIDIEKRMEQHLNLIEQINQEKPLAERFLVIFFNFINNFSDIEKILGATLANQISNTCLIFTGEPRTPEQIESFITKHNDYIIMLNERYMDNVLMTGEYNGS